MHATRNLISGSVAGVLLLIVFASVVCAQPVPKPTDDVVLTMPEPPDGYIVSKNRIVDNKTPIGIQVVIVKEGSPSKIVVTVETSRDISAHAARVAATKGYVNGTAEGLQAAGLKLKDSKLPDLQKTDFSSPLLAERTFTRPDDSEIYLRQIIFFTDKGYNVQVVAMDKAELESLTTWAKHIKPASISESSR